MPMDLGFTSGLAELLEEQRRRKELEALQQGDMAPAEKGATSPVLTPEMSTNGAQTATPAGQGTAPAGGDTAAYPAVLQGQPRPVDGPVPSNTQAATSGQASPGNRGLGYGMSSAAADMNALGADIQQAGVMAQPPPAPVDMLPKANPNALPTGVRAPGTDPAADAQDAVPFNDRADSLAAGMEARRSQQPISPIYTPQQAFKGQGNTAVTDAESRAGGTKQAGIGAALDKAGILPPAPPADPLAPKPKLTARQRAEQEIPPVDDMKGWQKLLLVMGAGLAGGLTKDAGLGAKLAAMTPYNRRERLVKDRIKEIQDQDKLDLDTKQTEAQIDATVKGGERADKQLGLTANEQAFSQTLRAMGHELDVKRLALDTDVRTMDAATKAAAVQARVKYNEILQQRIDKGQVLPAGAVFIDPQTGATIAKNPYQPEVTTSTDTKTVTAPDGKTFTEKNEKTETKSKGGTAHIGDNPAAAASGRTSIYKAAGGEGTGLSEADFGWYLDKWKDSGGAAKLGPFADWFKANKRSK